MPSMNQLLLGTQKRAQKKRMRDNKTPALKGSPQNAVYVFASILKHQKSRILLSESLQKSV